MIYRYVFASDIKQMFRQILIHKDDRKFQQIVWRFKSSDEISAHSLNTVTYGVVSSPFLANRVMKQLALDEGDKYPLAASIISSETYMDDTLSGGHSLPEALKKQNELINICKTAGFSLHKWIANDKILLNFPPTDLADSEATNDCFSLLGVSYNPSEDYFSFKIRLDEFKKPITKRMVVSNISKLFDPLGWLAPVMITAKVIIQKMWLAKLEWEDVLPETLKTEFIDWYNGLTVLNKLKIPRWLGYTTDAKYEIFGFADASKMAYAACVYLKVTVNGQSSIRLLQGKSKVSPIKPLLTIPKLELSAAFLLSKLTVKVLKSLRLPSVNVFLFTDSIDVLFWLKEHPSKWPVFIANKCSQIHSLVPTAFWSHVRSKENSADCVSRGIPPEQ